MKANTERLYNDVNYLTSIKPARNYRHPKALEQAATYIENELRKTGLLTETQKWEVEGEEYNNVLAIYNPGQQQTLVVGAHYDVCGDQPGADDNASAVAGLLELARMLNQIQPATDYCIEFVAYCLEEPPFFATDAMGSYIHARSLHEKNTEVIGMISLEMIGYFSDLPNSQPFPSPELAKIYPSTANFIIVVGIERYAAFNKQIHQLMSQNAGIDVQVIHFPDAGGLAGLSDQRSYWRFGYPALMINDTAFVRNPHYHLKSDTIDTLDFKKMTEVVNAAYKAVTGLTKKTV